MSRKRNSSLGVDWHLPRKMGGGFMARRFATTPPATSLSMQLLAGEGLTFIETHARYRHLREEGEIMQVFIDHGFGDRRLDEFITPALVG